MRELWETNRELQLRIDARTGRLERELAALSIVHRAVMAEIAATLDDVMARVESDQAIDGDVVERLRRVVASVVITPSREIAEPAAAGVLDVADDVLERWQHAAARSGQLLSVEADDTPAVTVRWEFVLAAIDTLLAVVTRHGATGPVGLALGVTPGGGLEVELRHPGAPESSTGSAAVRSGVELAGELVSAVDGTIDTNPDEDGVLVMLRFPPA